MVLSLDTSVVGFFQWFERWQTFQKKNALKFELNVKFKDSIHPSVVRLVYLEGRNVACSTHIASLLLHYIEESRIFVEYNHLESVTRPTILSTHKLTSNNLATVSI